MFASFIQSVTLIAFTAHAVLGCCWHHPHTTVDRSTAAAAETQVAGCSSTPGASACGHRLAERTRPACGPAPADKATAAAQASGVRYVEPNCCGSSHQPAGHCSSGRCSYISAKLLTLDLSEAASLEGFIAACDGPRRLPSVHANGPVGQRPFFLSPQSSGEYRAALQSWQI